MNTKGDIMKQSMNTKEPAQVRGIIELNADELDAVNGGNIPQEMHDLIARVGCITHGGVYQGWNGVCQGV